MQTFVAFFEGLGNTHAPSDPPAQGTIPDQEQISPCEVQVRDCSVLPYIRGQTILIGKLSDSKSFLEYVCFM